MNQHAFELFGLSLGFAIDLAELQKNYIAKSAEFHPDRFLDPLDQAEAAEKISEINDANRRLRDPESRANLLLEILGGPSKEADKSLPSELLMEMMEVREEQEEAESKGDAEKLTKLKRWAEERRDGELDKVSELFGGIDMRGDFGGIDAGVLKRIRGALNCLRYYVRMLEQLPEGV